MRLQLLAVGAFAEPGRGRVYSLSRVGFRAGHSLEMLMAIASLLQIIS